MTGTRNKPGPKLPPCPEKMGGTLPIEQKTFIFPLMHQLENAFDGGLGEFGKWTLEHRHRPAWANLTPTTMKTFVYARFGGSPTIFPEWHALTWVIDTLNPNATFEQREFKQQQLAGAWYAATKRRPPGYVGRLPHENALTHPSEAPDEVTELVVARKYVLRLERELADVHRELANAEITIAELRADNTPTGRHHLTRLDVDDHVQITVPEPDGALRSEIAAMEKRLTSTINKLQIDLHAAEYKVEELQTQLQAQQRRTRHDNSPATEVFPAVSGQTSPATPPSRGHVDGTEQRQPKFVQRRDQQKQRRKQQVDAWKSPEDVNSDDKMVDTTYYPPGTLHTLPGTTAEQTDVPSLRGDLAQAEPSAIKRVMDSRARD